MAKTDPRVTKRRVTMRNRAFAGLDDSGKAVYHEFTAVDYVRPDHLDAYLADLPGRWAEVEVSDEPDAGPGGYHGATHVPAHLDLPDAGVTYPATQED